MGICKQINDFKKHFKSYKLMLSIVLDSDSQPMCCGTLGCRKEVSMVAPNYELLHFIDVLPHSVPQIVIFYPAAKFFKT
jgi:hypothetical protein